MLPNHRLELTAALREIVRPRSLSAALGRSCNSCSIRFFENGANHHGAGGGRFVRSENIGIITRRENKSVEEEVS